MSFSSSARTPWHRCGCPSERLDDVSSSMHHWLYTQETDASKASVARRPASRAACLATSSEQPALSFNLYSLCQALLCSLWRAFLRSSPEQSSTATASKHDYMGNVFQAMILRCESDSEDFQTTLQNNAPIRNVISTLRALAC